MNELTIITIEADGGIIHLSDRTRALVNVKDHAISRSWSAGDTVLMIRQRNTFLGTFHLHKSKDEFVDCAWYSGNEQIV